MERLPGRLQPESGDFVATASPLIVIPSRPWGTRRRRRSPEGSTTSQESGYNRKARIPSQSYSDLWDLSEMDSPEPLRLAFELTSRVGAAPSPLLCATRTIRDPCVGGTGTGGQYLYF